MTEGQKVKSYDMCSQAVISSPVSVVCSDVGLNRTCAVAFPRGNCIGPSP